ncbi:uncharacterized protein LOC113295385 [Papaver somniferum]|uniref:uncharacterized protein LOC113295385 n=1 Tax=Papaver somniferum TaxID=3469 RepID=UPI000E6FB3BF|nr:uncharacterized protein LOC113295385 [Papaver somniferum]
MSEEFGNHLEKTFENNYDSEKVDFRAPTMDSSKSTIEGNDSPSLFIPDEVMDEYLDEWKFSLIGRLNLVKLKMSTVSETLLQQWQIKGKVQFIPPRKGFFIIKLDNMEDRNYIWRGLWKIELHILDLRAWKPNFNPAAQKTTSAYVWVIFPGLSIEYWKEHILMKMGNTLGRSVKVDEITLNRVAGYYACVLVEIDVSKSLPSTIWVNSKYGKFEQSIQIPNKPKFCSHCKALGHFLFECRSKRKENFQAPSADGFVSKPKKQWKSKQKQTQKKGFDICGFNSPSELNSDKILVNNVSASLQQNISYGRFHLLQNSTAEYNVDFPPLPGMESQKKLGESSGVFKEIQCSDCSSQATITASQIDQPIINEDSSDSSSEDGEIKEASSSDLIHSSTLASPVIILRNDIVSRKVITKKIITENKKPHAKPVKSAPVTRKASKESQKKLPTKGFPPQNLSQ